MTHALEARGLVRTYDRRRVVDVEHLSVDEGEVLAVLGPNGAGKSTLFRLLALLEAADEGTVLHFGREVKAGDLTSRRRTAAVFQRPLLIQGTVRQNVAFGLKLRRAPRRQRRERVEAALELMGIEAFASADVKNLSGGELQRVAIARALVLEPEILFLDEPTSNLDGGVRRSFREDLRDVVARMGVTVVLITHDQNEALSLAHRVAVMRDGRVVQQGSTEDVFAHPGDAFVADFMGVETIWHGRVSSCRSRMCTVRTNGGIRVEVPASYEAGEGDQVLLALRPEDVVLTSADGHASAAVSSARNRWPGVVEDVVFATPLVRVHVVLSTDVGLDSDASPAAAGDGSRGDRREGRLVALITRASAEELAIAPGRAVVATVKATALHMMRG